MQIQSYFFFPSVYEFPCSFPFPVVHTSTVIPNKSEENGPDTLTLILRGQCFTSKYDFSSGFFIFSFAKSLS